VSRSHPHSSQPSSNGHSKKEKSLREDNRRLLCAIDAQRDELQKKLGRVPRSEELHRLSYDKALDQEAAKFISQFRKRNDEQDNPLDEGEQAEIWARAGRHVLRELLGQDPDPAIKNLTQFKGQPTLREPVVNGLLRRGESANLIADPKVGKSWMVYGLALSVATGSKWLKRCACLPGRVLVVDYELHEELLRNRLDTVAEFAGVMPGQYKPRIDLLALRGKLPFDIRGLAEFLEIRASRGWDLVIVDALYRALPSDVAESDHTKLTSIYNLIDKVAARLDCAWVNVHHASKGNQSEKSITDVGSGAGVQSRAVDSHIILHRHQEEDCYVLEASVRSFPPFEPLGLRREYPLWRPDAQLDTSALRAPNSKKQAGADRQGKQAIVAALGKGNLTARQLRDETGSGHGRVMRLLGQLALEQTVLRSETVPAKGRATVIYRLARGRVTSTR
jgi:hypothetical protein